MQPSNHLTSVSLLSADLTRPWPFREGPNEPWHLWEALNCLQLFEPLIPSQVRLSLDGGGEGGVGRWRRSVLSQLVRSPDFGGQLRLNQGRLIKAPGIIISLRVTPA